MATIREALRLTELEGRKAKAKATKLDQSLKVGRGGAQIMLPEAIRPEHAVDAVMQWAKSESQIVQVQEKIVGVPIDAAHALQLAVEEEFGVRELKRSGFFGENPPPFVSVPTDAFGNSVDVYVGEFSLPGFDDAKFRSYPSAPLELTIAGKLRQKDLQLFRQLVATARRFLSTHSLYKGRAIIIDFDKANEGEMVIPIHWDVSEYKPIVLNDDTLLSIEADLWAPIEYTAAVRAMGTSVKRTVLLHGPFGTGKTLVAYETARRGVANGFTVLYIKNPDHLTQAIEFASAHYPPAILFCEDADKVFANADQLNSLQNVIDGIDGKAREIITVFTSNYVENLPPSILRPGRIDSVIPMPKANPKAAAELVQLYAGDSLDPDSDMQIIGEAVRGKIPAVVREIVERSKLRALTRNGGKLGFTINHIDVASAAQGMDEHLRLLYAKRDRQQTPVELLGTAMGREIARGFRNVTAQVLEEQELEMLGDEITPSLSMS